MGSTNSRSARREAGLASVFWCVILAVLIVEASAVGLAKRGFPLEGWSGSPTETIAGWTLLTAPYVLVAWFPIAAIGIACAGLSPVSRGSWVAISVFLAIGLFALFGFVA